MSEIKDGGPAFARNQTYGGHGQTGMSLREYFAAAALTGLMANPQTFAKDKEGALMVARVTSQAAYMIADAMLAARDTPSGEA